MCLQLLPQLDPLTLGHPGLFLAGTFDPFLGLAPLILSSREPGFFPELIHEYLSFEQLIVHGEIHLNYQAPRAISGII